jgi:hypothetical protein
MDMARLKKVLAESLPVDVIERLTTELGVRERQAKVRLQELVMALVLTARTGRRQADAFKH